MPIVVLVSAATAGIIYVSIGQVLEASARDIATAEAVELRGRAHGRHGRRPGRGPRGRRRHPRLAGRRRHRHRRDDDRRRRCARRWSTRGSCPARCGSPPSTSLPGLDDRGFAVAAADADPPRRAPLHRARRGGHPGRGRRAASLDGVRAHRRGRPGGAARRRDDLRRSARRCDRSSGCATRSRASSPPARRRCWRCRRVATSCPGWPRPSTRCWNGSGGPTSRGAPSSPMPGTSCAARSRRSGCCSTASPRTARLERAPAWWPSGPRRRWTASRCSSTTCSPWRRPTSAR